MEQTTTAPLELEDRMALHVRAHTRGRLKLDLDNFLENGSHEDHLLMELILERWGRLADDENPNAHYWGLAEVCGVPEESEVA
jgi:hypothetical protein